MSSRRPTSDTGSGRITAIRHDTVLRWRKSRLWQRIYFQGILVSHKLASALFAALFLAISSFSGANAEPAVPAANSTVTLSPDEAKRALETLQDDNKRMQMIDTLRAIANVSSQQQPA